MNLHQYHCTRLELRWKLPCDTPTWRGVTKFFSAGKGLVKKQGRPTAIRAVLESKDRNVDYHYHFSADRTLKKGKPLLELDISLHADDSSHKGRTSRLTYEIPELELWLHKLLGPGIKERALRIEWNAQFIFGKETFGSVFPMPFKSPFKPPSENGLLGKVSISGLKLKMDDSPAGLETVYFEAFPRMIIIGTYFGQKMVIKEGIVEYLLKTAATVASFLVKEERSNEFKHA